MMLDADEFKRKTLETEKRRDLANKALKVFRNNPKMAFNIIDLMEALELDIFNSSTKTFLLLALNKLKSL